MDEARIDRAMNRIEAALSRVERASQSALAQDSALTQRHDELRQRVGTALKELDTLIGGLEP